MENELDSDIGVDRRRVPRCSMQTQVGVMHRGVYRLEQTFQVGEGGLMISSAQTLEVGEQVVVNFILYGKVLIIVRSKVRSALPAKMGFPVRYGLEFVDLDFHYKREIRNFVASATVASGAALSNVA